MEDIKRWSYLKDVDLTQINVNAGLPIGMNAPKALELWRIINSKGTGKYAVKNAPGVGH